MQNSNFQAPNSKKISNLKFQTLPATSTRNDTCQPKIKNSILLLFPLNIGIWSLFGILDLKLGIFSEDKISVSSKNQAFGLTFHVNASKKIAIIVQPNIEKITMFQPTAKEYNSL